MIDRIERLRRLFLTAGIEALLISKDENIYYLTGFTGGNDGRVLITADRVYLATDRRYELQSHNECSGVDIIIETEGGYKQLAKKYHSICCLGVESHHITWLDYQEISAPYTGKIISSPDFVESLRVYKDETELESLRQSAKINDEVFASLLPGVKPGIKEKDLAVEINNAFRVRGCSREAFAAIVLTGANAALPHGTPGDACLCPGDMITIDMGGVFEHYVSDMTRTIALGNPDSRFQEVYHILKQAQELGLTLVKPGVSCREIDVRIREFLDRYKLKEHFAHGAGHGIGLEIHEKPTVSFRSDEVLEENMVITIEPGIYIAGWGGIRIEDSVIVTGQGCESITKTTKELLVI